jgi:transcriptional regulator with XRE-family HTH domain
MNLGDRIRKRREDLGITQSDLSKSVGTTPQHISVIEMGRRSPSIELLAKMAQELGVSVDFLISGKEVIITDIVPAIRADKVLRNEIKRSLITLINDLRSNTTK